MSFSSYEFEAGIMGEIKIIRKAPKNNNFIWIVKGSMI